MKIVLTGRRLALGSAVLLLMGGLVAGSGLIDIAASSGHWKITEWVLHGAMRASIRTHALLEPHPPADLDSPARVRRAAGHYETACAFCHGSPLRPPPMPAARMTPAPPALTHAAGDWRVRELFRIVRHGVKYTGMPAWSAPDRADEVWAMVALLRAMPGMSGETYGRLAFGDPVPEDQLLARCARCHGRDGASAGGAFPVIGGQSEAYLLAALRAYADGSRSSGIMRVAVDGLALEDLERLAGHYATQPGLSTHSLADDTSGARIAFQGLPENDVPACESCHGPHAGRNPNYPYLAGQDEAYLAARLRQMKDSTGAGYARIMHRIAARLPEAAIAAVTGFYSRQDPRLSSDTAKPVAR